MQSEELKSCQEICLTFCFSFLQIGTYVSAAMLISSVANTEQALAKDEAISRAIREKEKAWKTANEPGQGSKRGQNQRRGKGSALLPATGFSGVYSVWFLPFLCLFFNVMIVGDSRMLH